MRQKTTNRTKYSTIVTLVLIFEHLPGLTCLISHFHCSKYERNQPYLLSDRRRHISKSIEKHTTRRDFDCFLSSSVTNLFDLLDEEAGNDRDNNHIIDSSQSTSSEMNNQDSEEEEEIMVSDAEALLACWSFLKRRKRLAWSDYEERQAQKAFSQNYFLTDDDVGDTVFDEDDDDDDGEYHNNFEDFGDDLNFNVGDGIGGPSITTVQDLLSRSGDENILDADNDSEDLFAKDLMSISNFISGKDDPDTPAQDKEADRISEPAKIDLWHTEFTSFPVGPSESRTRRVNAMKRRWEDPAYKKRWYEKRWGSKSKHQREQNTNQTHRERQAIQRARALPSGFLGSDELASMTEEEIAIAIRTRIRSTQKRVARRKQTLQRRKDILAAQMKALETMSDDSNNLLEDDPPREILFSPTNKTLLEQAKRKRSERAKSLYATRLKNRKRDIDNKSTEISTSASLIAEGSAARKKGPYFPPKQPTPRDAFLRIENDLDNGNTPATDDVHLILEPGRMKNRKQLLRRVLQDEFNLSGKCVPPLLRRHDQTKEDNCADENGRGDQDLGFVTHCTVERLGTFVIRLLNEKHSSSLNSTCT